MPNFSVAALRAISIASSGVTFTAVCSASSTMSIHSSPAALRAIAAASSPVSHTGDCVSSPIVSPSCDQLTVAWRPLPSVTVYTPSLSSIPAPVSAGVKTAVRPSPDTSQSKNASIAGVKPYCPASACRAAVLASTRSEKISPAASAAAAPSSSTAARTKAIVFFIVHVLSLVCVSSMRSVCPTRASSAPCRG